MLFPSRGKLVFIFPYKSKFFIPAFTLFLWLLYCSPGELKKGRVWRFESTSWVFLLFSFIVSRCCSEIEHLILAAVGTTISPNICSYWVNLIKNRKE